MNFFSINHVRLGDGTPAAKYMVCVPSETLKRVMALPDSDLKKYLPTHAENGATSETKVAAILGGIICAGDCNMRFNQWVEARVPDVVPLPMEPEKLPQPTLSLMQGEYPEVRIWLLESFVNRQPSFIKK
jgi:hypothetical protein